MELLKEVKLCVLEKEYAFYSTFYICAVQFLKLVCKCRLFVIYLSIFYVKIEKYGFYSGGVSCDLSTYGIHKVVNCIK